MTTVQKSRKPRFAFTVEKDIRLLRAALCANPWQTGREKWQDVVKVMEMEFRTKLTIRTVAGRINLLRENFKKQLLRSKTGTEEQETERGSLLSELEIIISEEDASTEINDQLNDETEISIGDASDDGHDDAHDDAIAHSGANENDQKKQSSNESDQRHEETITSAKRKSRSACPKSVKQKRIDERATANEERQKHIDEANDPVHRKPRGRLSLEDEMIIKRQDHEIEMDKERLALDKERLEIDKRRECRIEEETRRRDDLHMSQMLLQQSMIALINKVLYSSNM